jgi:hypothetical protein
MPENYHGKKYYFIGMVVSLNILLNYDSILTLENVGTVVN